MIIDRYCKKLNKYLKRFNFLLKKYVPWESNKIYKNFLYNIIYESIKFQIFELII